MAIEEPDSHETPTTAGSDHAPEAPTAQALEAEATTAGGAPLADAARFVPGTVVAGRYRIVSALGRGGMGEVYRADDLRLDQQVALKFLPQERAANPQWVDRLAREVRLARDVSHPNVCRVYDFVDTGNEQLVTMEYVDGESLTTLLRRVGRLPGPMALDIAHQITRALGAVHAKGILHRDLKPSNVMIDGRGQARLLDFGIASLAGHGSELGALLGTPAYMAPEQLLGGAPSSRSDVFALGVVLFELFTGRHPFGAQNTTEAARARVDTPPLDPMALVPDLDARIGRIVLQCLDRDPTARPASARAVVAALPGDDPLAAALAAGATPDREIVAAADDIGTLSRGLAWSTLTATVVALGLFAMLTPHTSLVAQITGIGTPSELSEGARSVLGLLGWSGANTEVTHGFDVKWRRFHQVAREDESPYRWLALLRPSPLYFSWTEKGQPDPNSAVEGPTAAVILDHSGRLVHVVASPPLAPAPAGDGAPPWNALFEQAGLDVRSFAPVPARPRSATDRGTNLAWEGPSRDGLATRLRVSAAAAGFNVASFRVAVAEDAPDEVTSSYARQMRLGHVVEATGIVLAVLVALWLALRHVRSGRGDREGAQRLAAAVLLVALVSGLLRGIPLLGLGQRLRVSPVVGEALVLAALAWVLYLAAEPYARRHAPRTMVGWARLLGGHGSDPLVGRDVLAGVLAGATACLMLSLIRLPVFATIMPPLAPFIPSGQALVSPAHLVARILGYAGESVAFGLGVLVALVGMRALVRNELVASAAVLLAILAPHAIWGLHHPLPFLIVHVTIFALPIRLLHRTGVLALMVFYFTYSVLVNLVSSVDWTTWVGRRGLFSMAVLLAMAVWGFRRALGTEPAWVLGAVRPKA